MSQKISSMLKGLFRYLDFSQLQLTNILLKIENFPAWSKKLLSAYKHHIHPSENKVLGSNNSCLRLILRGIMQ